MKKSGFAVLSRICAVVLVFALASIGAYAQVQNGVISGTVSDPSGAAVTGAEVGIVNVDTGQSSKITTNSSGVFRSQELPVGNYKITVSATGFKKAEKASFKLDVGVVARLDFKLTVGKVEEVVEVTTEAALVNTEDIKLTANVGAAQIAGLPLNGRNVYDLMQLAPGAVNVRGVLSENGAGTVVNGVREDFNGFLLNGVSNKGLSGGALNQPIQDTVQEFQQLTVNNSAQYGNSASSIVSVVTKGGTNQLKGTAFYFMRNQKLDANDFFSNHGGFAKQPLNFKQFGVTVGGPIIKGKLFFYGAYQGDRFLTSSPAAIKGVESAAWRAAVIAAQPNSVAALLYKDFVPNNFGSTGDTVDQYLTGTGSTSIASADFGGSVATTYLCDLNTGRLAIAQKLATIFGVTAADQTALGAAGCTVLPIQAGTFNRANPFVVDLVSRSRTQGLGNLFDGNEFNGRVDYNISTNDRLFGSFNWQRSQDKFLGGLNGVRGTSSPVQTTFPNLQLSYTHVFSPNVVNEFKGGYAGSLQNLTTAQGGVPFIGFDDASVGFGSYNGYPQNFKENIYTYSDMVSITKGKHNMKAGVDVRRNIENSEFNVARPSYYFFDQAFFAADAPYTETAGVDPGFATGGTPRLQSNIRHWRNVEFGAYFNDDWKLSRRLTVTLGMRYDLYTRHNELNNLATTFILGPGTDLVDGVRKANQLAGTGTCTTATQIAQVVMAGVCGPGGFSAAPNLGPGDRNNFGPRAGFAYDVFGNGKTALRGGFGLSYEGTLYNPLSNSRWNPPYYSFNSYCNDIAANQGFCANAGAIVYGPSSGGAPSYTGAPDPLNGQGAVGQAQAQGNIGGWNPAAPNQAILTGIVLQEGIRDPYVYNAYLGVQHEIAPKLVLEMNYVGTWGHRLFRAENINRSAGGRLPAGVCITTADSLARTICSNGTPNGRPNGNYGNLRNWRNVVNSNYNALQASLKKSMSHGLQFNLSYTWSHALDGGSTWHSGATSSNGAAAGEGYTYDAQVPSLDNGNSIFDIRHRLVFNYVWDLPSLKDRGQAMHWIFGDWSYNGIVSYQSGAHWSPYSSRSSTFIPDPLFPTACAAATFDATRCYNNASSGIGGDYNLDGITNDRPNSTVTTYSPSTSQQADGWGNRLTLFSAPCLGCIGNLRRNQFVGPSYINFDMGLIKNIPITERFKLQFRWDVFNVFNKTNFQLPGANGQVYNRVNIASFGQAGATFNPRQMQFGLRLSF